MAYQVSTGGDQVICVPTIILIRTRTKSVNKLRRKDQSNLMSSMIRTSCSEPREQYSNTIAVRVESLSQPVGDRVSKKRGTIKDSLTLVHGK